MIKFSRAALVFSSLMLVAATTACGGREESLSDTSSSRDAQWARDAQRRLPGGQTRCETVQEYKSLNSTNCIVAMAPVIGVSISEFSLISKITSKRHSANITQVVVNYETPWYIKFQNRCMGYFLETLNCYASTVQYYLRTGFFAAAGSI